MQMLTNAACGLDVHKDKIDACIRINDGTVDGRIEQKTFSTMRGSLTELCSWIISHKCFKVLMESTSIYWMPIYFLLEEISGMDVGLGNARHMKNVPGRPKTDKEDSKWISRLCIWGLILKSFVVGKPFRNLREYTRYHKKLVQDRARQKNRIEKLLQMNGFKLSSVLSDTTGVSGLRILQKLCDRGSLTASDIRSVLDKRVKKTAEEIEFAINGTMKPTSCILLKKHLEKLASCDKEINEIYDCMVELSKEHTSAINIIKSIPGLDVLSAIYVIAEIGTDLSSFQTSKHLASWAGLAPNNNESAGKVFSRKTKKANQYVKSVLVECAWGTTKTRGTRLSKWYWSHVGKLGQKKAITALARKLLCYIYAMLKSGTLYDDSPDYADMESSRAEKPVSAKKTVDNQKCVTLPGSSVVITQNSSIDTDQKQTDAESIGITADMRDAGEAILTGESTPHKKRGRPKKIIESPVSSPTLAYL